MRPLKLLLVLFVCGAVAPAVAGPLEDAEAAYDKGDYETALGLIRPLAELGVAPAQYNLGNLYRLGQGAPRDYAIAISWYRKAAEQGLAPAQYNLGFMYDYGHGVPQDYAVAASWYRKAAEQGDDSAQNNLGSMYESGQGVPQDYVQAHMWFSLAGALAGEREEREKSVKNRDKVAAKMTPAQIAEAQRLAREWKPKTDAR